MPETDDRLGDLRSLQSGINDLVTVLAFPARSCGHDAGAIVSTLLDGLVGLLRLDIAYARLSAVVDGVPIETLRVADRRCSAEQLPRGAEAIAAAIAGDTPGPRRMLDPLGGGLLSVACCRLGLADEIGVLAAASARPDFPTQMEMLLLQVAANQAAVGLLEARRLNDQTRELGRAITERHQIEVERRRLASLVENSPDFIGFATFDRRVHYINPAGQRIVGIDGDARVRATTMDDYLLPEDRDRMAADIVPALLRDGRWEGELRFRHFQTGAAIPLLHQIFVVDDADRDQPVIATISRDITERKHEEAELVALKDELAAELIAMTALHEFSTRLLETTELQPLLKDMLDAIVALQNADLGMVQLHNPVGGTLDIVEQRGFAREFLEQINGLGSEGLPYHRAFHTGQRVIVPDITADTTFAPHLGLMLAAGIRAVQATPLFSRTGEPLGVVSTQFRRPHRPSQHELRLTDLYARQAAEMIERKRAEDALRRSEDSLRAAQVELARISRVTTMGELTASIAHEVNQPLAAVVANGNACLRWLAGETPNLEEAREGLNRIVRDAMRASGVVARIRALVMKSGTDKECLDLNDAIQEVVTITKGEGRRHGVTLRTELARDLPPVLGDRVQLQQVVLNLIVNGIEATPVSQEQTSALVISTRYTGGDHVCVLVRDAGIGIGDDADRQSLEQVFEPFFTTKPQGMGIGLSISRSIVEAHDGRLWAERNDDAGTTFTFTLPIHTAT
jgi:PAS domain S-box-containing protein